MSARLETKDQAIERACDLHTFLDEGEDATGATERWVEIAEDESQPGPIEDVRCWVVEFSGDDGPTVDLFIAVEDGREVKRMTY